MLQPTEILAGMDVDVSGALNAYRPPGKPALDLGLRTNRACEVKHENGSRSRGLKYLLVLARENLPCRTAKNSPFNRMMKNYLTPLHFPARITCLAIYLLVAAGITGCASQDQRILARTGDLKTQTLALMDKAVEPYGTHAGEIDAQNVQLERLYDQERARPGNGPTTRMWTTLLQTDPQLPGSGIYPRFLDQWKKKNVLSSGYIDDKKETVGNAFDKIMSLESAKSLR